MRTGLGKRLFTVILAVMLGITMTGCDGAVELSEAFEEEKVLTEAEKAVEALNICDFQAIEDMVDDEFKEQISAKILQSSLEDTMKEMGEFDSYKSESVVGLSTKDYDGDVAVAVLNALYEYGSRTVTISYNTDYKIIGFYVK